MENRRCSKMVTLKRGKKERKIEEGGNFDAQNKRRVIGNVFNKYTSCVLFLPRGGKGAVGRERRGGREGVVGRDSGREGERDRK